MAVNLGSVPRIAPEKPASQPEAVAAPAEPERAPDSQVTYTPEIEAQTPAVVAESEYHEVSAEPTAEYVPEYAPESLPDYVADEKPAPAARKSRSRLNLSHYQNLK